MVKQIFVELEKFKRQSLRTKLPLKIKSYNFFLQ